MEKGLLVKIEINSTWNFKNVESLDNGIYRILGIENNISLLIIFQIIESDKIIRPSLITIPNFIDYIKTKSINKLHYYQNQHLLEDEGKISEKYKLIRNTRFSKIESLITDANFLFEIASKKKSLKISKQAKLNNTDNKSIYRLLNLYWKYGQTENALLPKYSYSGAKGVIRENVKKSLGTQSASRTGQYNKEKSYIVKKEDRIKFEKILKKYYLKPQGLNLKETYKNLLRMYYKLEILDAKYLDIIPGVPSYRQFVNWSKKLINRDLTDRLRTTEIDYLRNKRSVEAAITDKTPVLGSAFEIDATVADVHIVSELRRNHVIGRPTIYSLIDRASRMIVGFHVSLYNASWFAARQALVNAFLPKVDYCLQFGIDINYEEWPCHHIPQRIICDNGELIGLKPEKYVVPLTELQIAPPYRPDCKSLVERRFGYINDKSLHRLLGSSKGGKIVRGSPDPRQKAVYTLQEVTAILLKDVVEHNKEIFNDLALSSRLLIENDLSPTPINYWNIHLLRHKHALKIANFDEINARLLPTAEVSMTRSGILFNEMYYSCQRIKDENLTAIARNAGRYRLEARINYDNTSVIYVRLRENEGFTRCELSERSAELKDLPLAEVHFLQDWLDDKKRKQPVTVSSIENLEFKEKINKKAQKLSKDAPKLKTKKERTANAKQRRAIEIEFMDSQTDKEIASQKMSSNKSDVKEIPIYHSKVSKLPRRKK